MAQHASNKMLLSSPDILGLANNVLEDTKNLVQHLLSTGHPLPTFARGSTDLPDTNEYNSIQESLLSNLQDLQYLVEGPKRSMTTFLRLHQDLGALQIAFEFDFFRLIPCDGAIDVADLSQKAGLDEDTACRMLRMLATHRVFAESTPRHFTHTPSSLLFHQDEEIRCTGEYISTWNITLELLRRASRSRGKSIGKSILQAASLGAIFMVQFLILEEEAVTYLWLWLESEFQGLEFIVQDKSPNMLAEGKKMVAQEEQAAVRDRIVFMQHDFFHPQPVRDISAVLLRQVTHNWTDEQVVTIFKGIIPALESSKPGTPFLINDTVMPEPGELFLYTERILRNLDLLMFTCLGAKQRTLAQFTALLKEADERYNVRNVYTSGNMGIIEVYLEA
ncbi:hypothetical protein Hte_005793 [Hypoxylon texense]